MNQKDLSKYDFYVLIDKSGSMGDPVKSGGISKWEASRELVKSVAREASQYDDDGITLVLFSSNPIPFDNIGGGADKELALQKVDDIFMHNSPNGGTDTAKALHWVFDGYLDRKRKNAGEAKPIICVVVTDGAPDSEPEVVRAIVEFTRKLDSDDEAGVSFLQIGNDQHAREFLKRLDDDLVKKNGAKFDIVDTKNMSELDSISLTDILLSAVND